MRSAGQVDERDGERWQWVPLCSLALFWVVARLASSQGGAMVWIELARSGTQHGLGDLQKITRFVTLFASLAAALGAFLRLGSARGPVLARRLGFIATCTPLTILLSGWGAVAFLSAALLVAFSSGVATLHPDATRSQVAQREAFALLSGVCFAALGPEYNAELLTKALLVAVGTSLLVRAALPQRSKPEKRA